MDICFHFFHQGIHIGVDLFDHRVIMFTFKELKVECFVEWLHHFAIPLAMYESSISYHLHAEYLNLQITLLSAGQLMYSSVNCIMSKVTTAIQKSVFPSFTVISVMKYCINKKKMNANKEYGSLNSKLNALERLAKNELRKECRDFPGGLVVKNLPANAGDMGSIPGLGRFHVLWGN